MMDQDNAYFLGVANDIFHRNYILSLVAVAISSCFPSNGEYGFLLNLFAGCTIPIKSKMAIYV